MRHAERERQVVQQRPLGHDRLPDHHGRAGHQHERGPGRRQPPRGRAGSAVTLSPDVYEVQAGDYWYGIAKKLNVDVNALWAANNANSKTLLLPGKRLAVPKPGDAAGLQPPAAGGGAPAAAGSTAAPAPTLAPGTPPGSYQIVAGDYWIGIAKKLNVSLNALLQANNATTKTVLIPGKYLKVPKA